MSIYETTIKNPKKIAEFYKQLSEQKDIEIKQLKQKLQQRDNIINKIIEIKYNFQNENSLLIFENENLLKFMNDLQDVFNLKIRSDK